MTKPRAERPGYQPWAVPYNFKIPQIACKVLQSLLARFGERRGPVAVAGLLKLMT